MQSRGDAGSKQGGDKPKLVNNFDDGFEPIRFIEQRPLERVYQVTDQIDTR